MFQRILKRFCYKLLQTLEICLKSLYNKETSYYIMYFLIIIANIFMQNVYAQNRTGKDNLWRPNFEELCLCNNNKLMRSMLCCNTKKKLSFFYEKIRKKNIYVCFRHKALIFIILLLFPTTQTLFPFKHRFIVQ